MSAGRAEFGLRVVLALAAMAIGLPGDPIRAEAQTRTRADEAVTTETARAIGTLSDRLSSTHSATAVLEAWCAERGLAEEPRLIARRMPGPEKAPSDEQRARLAVKPGDAVRYRRVQLRCGSHVLSEADNWYVPARLTPEMNATLDATDTPFGRVVRPLAPTRKNLALEILWPISDERRPAAGDALLAVRALLFTRDGVPFCEVAEVYTGAILARGGD